MHTQNDPSKPFQRENIIKRKSAVNIRCSSVDVIYGLFASKGNDQDVFYTLLVL